MKHSLKQMWQHLDKNGRLMILREYISRLVMLLILLGISGNWGWVNGWLFSFFALLTIIVVHWVVVRNNPDLYNERGAKHSDAKPFDAILLPCYALGGYAVLIIAALDERFSWSDLNSIWISMGIGLMILTAIITTSAMASNPFFSSTVRIQKERGQEVVDSGPYHIIRHPGYMGGILFYLAAFCMLDSYWVLIPVLITLVIIIIRTKMEDDTLQNELEGYSDYSKNVCYRLIPGVW